MCLPACKRIPSGLTLGKALVVMNGLAFVAELDLCPFCWKHLTRTSVSCRTALLSTGGIIQIKPSLQGTNIKAFTVGNVFTIHSCWNAEASRMVTMVREEACHSPAGWYLPLANRSTPAHSQNVLSYRYCYMKS